MAKQPNFNTDDAEAADLHIAGEGVDSDATDPQGRAELSETEQLQLERDDANNRALRAQADLDNFRKRVQREQAQDRRYAGIHLLRDLLPVVDNIQRAIEAAEASQESGSLLEGFKLVAQQLQTVLAQHNCLAIQSVGETFDPNLHEAVSQMASDEHPQGTVVMETATGYQLHDRVVRPSQVIVSTGLAAE